MYDTEELFDRAIYEIGKKKLVFHYDVYGILGIASSTYYEHFPRISSEYKEISMALSMNTVSIMAGIRSKWYASKSDQGKLYLYKLLCGKEEREKLSVNYNKNEQIGPIEINANLPIADMPDELLEQLELFYLEQAKKSEL